VQPTDNVRKAHQPSAGLTLGRRGDSGPSGADRVLGVRVRGLHLRLPLVSRFAALLPAPDLANQLLNDGMQKIEQNRDERLESDGAILGNRALSVPLRGVSKLDMFCR